MEGDLVAGDFNAYRLRDSSNTRSDNVNSVVRVTSLEIVLVLGTNDVFSAPPSAIVEKIVDLCQEFHECSPSGHGIAGTVSGVEAAIHCGDELWFGVGMEVSERDQNKPTLATARYRSLPLSQRYSNAGFSGPRRDLLSRDGLHLSYDGTETMESAIENAVNTALTLRTGAPPSTALSPRTGAPPTTALSPRTGAPPTTALSPRTGAPPTTALSPRTGAPPTTALSPRTGAPPTTAQTPRTGAPPTTALSPRTGAPPTTTLSPRTGAPPTTALSPRTGAPPTTALSPRTGASPTTALSPRTGAPPTTALSPRTGAPSTTAQTPRTGAPSTTALSPRTGAPPSTTLAPRPGAPPTTALILMTAECLLLPLQLNLF
ncbi:melanoma-associated antigen E1-like [Mya arenaria]|uniref:melanoma-associated antigen E1-like n=1 Tax=Mya arenaria TaxID=6604 RepID=UPI0022DEFDA3|nr:melanoma-associated antigen E1-like [Mya arenaria]